MKKRRGLQVRNPELFVTHDEAAAFLDEADAWLRRTGTAWSHLCRLAKVHSSVRGSVRERENGMSLQALNNLRAVIEQHPDGLRAEDCGLSNDKLTQAQTAALAEDIRDWLERTGTALWRIGLATGRTGSYLSRWLREPRPITIRVAERFRAVMAEHPEGMGEPVHKDTLSLAEPVEPLPPFDPLAERRGEAERRRREWIAQQAAEHQRKYKRPMGRPIEEMVA
jgi:hypothetical protein